MSASGRSDPSGPDRETIFALSTAPGRAGVAVFRLSGPAAFAALEALTGAPPPPPRRAALRALTNPASGALLDRGLVMAFPGPGSFTGEDVAELHTHGGAAVVAAVAAALTEIAGLRPAAAGEFTRRAFENGRLDLAQVEGLADLIDAETEAQRLQALRQMDGALGQAAEGWREKLTAALALLAAEIDFPDEEDAPNAVADQVRPLLAALEDSLEAHLKSGVRAQKLRDGFEVALIGAPNKGKSSLMNRLAQREVAIVSAQPGATRDVLEARLDLEGYPVVLADTAGLREAVDNDIEAEGVRRALARAEAADLRLRIVEAGEPAPPVAPGAWTVINKIDLNQGLGPVTASEFTFPVSAKTGEGIAALEAALAAAAREALSAREAPGLTRARHRQAVTEALAAVARAGTRLDGAPELAAEDLRMAARRLAALTGAVDVEDVLDRVFSAFCIGK